MIVNSDCSSKELENREVEPLGVFEESKTLDPEIVFE
jgi:hypothetical protein